MTITVSTGAEFTAAAEELFAKKIAEILPKAQIEISARVFQTWSNAKWTWSPKNPDDIWSGRARGSLNIAIGEPDPSALPRHPATIWGKGHAGRMKGVHRAAWWPDPVPGPYEAKDVFEAKASISGLVPYQVVWISDNVPYAHKIEDHTNIAHAAATFAVSHYKDCSWSTELAIK